MNEKLHSVWPILAHDGVGDAIGDARPIFVVTADGRLLHFANAAGARFLGIAPARALDARVSLEPRLADRLARFAAGTRIGATSRELVRFFDGLRSSLLSLGLARLDRDVILVTVDNARTVAADADPAASLTAIAAEGGLVALFDGDGDVVVALGDHAALDGVQDEIEAALDAEDGDPVFEHRVEAGGRTHDLALVRLGTADHPRRLMRVGPAAAASAPAPSPAAPAEPAAPLVEAGPSAHPTVPSLPLVAPAETLPTDEVEGPADRDGPVIPAAIIPSAAVHPPEEVTEDLAAAIAAVVGEAESPASVETAAAPPVAEPAAPVASLATAERTIAAPVAELATPELDTANLPEAAIIGPAVAAIDATIGAIHSRPRADDEPRPVVSPAGTDVAPPAATHLVDAEPSEGANDRPERAVAVEAATTQVEPTVVTGRQLVGRAVKFVWQMDAERRFTLVSDEFAAAVGPRAAAIVGRSWREVADDFGLDGDGRVAAALERRDTWSGRTVAWPVEGEALRLPVDLAALPAFDRGRVFTGYRGFGTVRGDEPIPDPTGTGLRLRGPDPTPLPAVKAAAETNTAAQAAAETTTAAVVERPLAAIESTSAAVSSAASLLAPAAIVASAAAMSTAGSTGDGEYAPPAYPDDAEVALVEAMHPHSVEPTIDGGEAAFAGEIETADRPCAAALVDLPDDWYDDELALAMATLPACGEGAVDSEAEDAAAPAPTGEEPATEAGEPLLPPATASPAPLAAPPVAEIAEPAPAPAAPPEPPEALLTAPVSPLALWAEDARRAAEALHAAEAAPPAHGPEPSATAPAPISREARLAEAPAALRAAVAEIEARAAELEPRIVLPVREAPEADAASDADAARPLVTETAATEPVGADHRVVEAHAEHRTAPSETPTPHDHVAEPDEPSAVEPDRDAERPATADGTRAEAPASLAAASPPTGAAEPVARIVALTGATRPPADAVRLSQPERVAFRQIAEALGARIDGEERSRAGTPAPAATAEAAKPGEPATAPADRDVPLAGATAQDTRLLDRLPSAVAVVKDDNLVYGNDAFLRLLGYPDLAILEAEGGLDALFAGEHVARRWKVGPDGSRPVPVLARDGRVIPVDAQVATVPWGRGSALMLTLSEVEAPEKEDAAEPTAVADHRPAAAFAAPTETVPPVSAAMTPESAAPAVTAPAALATPTVASADGALRERVGELEAIIDTATDGVLMLDAEGTILSANHAAEALFGTDRADMIGRPLADRLAPESRRSAMDYLDGLARNGVASVLNDGREVIGVVERGGLIPLFMTIGRISVDPSRKYCAVLRDITHWKKSEEDLTAARRRAEEASVHKSDFLAKISHEIRTPLNAIIGFSEVMIDERFGPVGNERYKDYLRDIHSSGSHIMSLINDLLDLSKVEAGKMDLRFEAVTLADIMSECVAMMQPQANRERIIIRSSLPAGVPPVVADPRSVRQVVLNLLSNAIKFTPSGGQVIVSTTLEDSGEVVMRVRDTGYGMTEKELQTAMEPFRQLHTTRSRGGGTGLGLPLTKALVEANRAVLRIDSTVGQGTLVTVTFPVTRVLAS